MKTSNNAVCGKEKPLSSSSNGNISGESMPGEREKHTERANAIYERVETRERESKSKPKEVSAERTQSERLPKERKDSDKATTEHRESESECVVCLEEKKSQIAS